MYTPRHPVQIDSPTKTASCCFYRQFKTSRDSDLRAGYGGYLVRGLAELPDRNGDFAFFSCALQALFGYGLSDVCVCVCLCVCEPFMQASTHTEREREKERKRESVYVCKILQVPPLITDQIQSLSFHVLHTSQNIWLWLLAASLLQFRITTDTNKWGAFQPPDQSRRRRRRRSVILLER